MAVHRFFTPRLESDTIELDEQQAAHARRVLRLGPGDEALLLDGAGMIAEGRVLEARRTLRIEVLRRRRVPRPQPWIDLAIAIPKGARADTLIETASQLGADRLLPLLARRSVVKPRGGKLGRFERLVIESARQCGRPWLLEIGAPTSFDALLDQADHDLKLIADTQSPQHPHAVEADPSAGPPPRRRGAARRVLVLIGPEGGWTDAERRAALAAGCRPWRLGPYILRIETAAAAALAILRRDR